MTALLWVLGGVALWFVGDMLYGKGWLAGFNAAANCMRTKGEGEE